MNSVEKIDANAAENPVQSTTSTKISQTWLASHTGPIAQSIRSRARRPRSPRPADQAPEPGAEVRAAEHGVRRHAGPQDRGDGIGAAHAAPRPSTGGADGPYGTSESSSSAARQRRAIARSVTTSAAPSTA